MQSWTQDGMLDPALGAKVLFVSYADDSGFDHAIDVSSKFIADVKFAHCEEQCYGEMSIQHVYEAEEKDQFNFYHPTSNDASEVENNQFSVRCLATKYNPAVEFVTNKTQEGRQTFKGICEEDNKGF
ncbi:hypothetical protein MKX03_011167 [Papaver bracteatum]|nr:hypothetical protein MKX03_019545 [Papaver bracteatum]KAI3891682.1 hypothetical protein MKX03_011167 [Papaver bracteatum]